MVAALAIVPLAALSAWVGFFEVSLGWTVGRAAVLAAITGFGVYAIEADDHSTKIRSLWLTIASLIVLVAGIGAYSATRNDDQAPSSYEFIVDVESEVQMLRPSAEPGGPQLIFLPPLEGLKAYRFVCKVALSDGSVWFRLAGEPSSFVHAAFLRRPRGSQPVTLPAC